MMLLEDVLDASGCLLVPKATVINEAHLKVFRSRSVTEINAEPEEGIEEVKVDKIPEEFLLQAHQALEKRLVHNDMKHPFIKELSGLAVQHIANRLMKEKQS